MFDALRRPIPWTMIAGGTGLIVLAVALYCMAYTALAGRPETFAQSIGWAIVNLAPWPIALEAAKRVSGNLRALGLVLVAGVVSVALGWGIGPGGWALEFEILRRVPPILLVAAVVLILRSGLGRTRQATADIPLLPGQIDWVRAAGNYVEIRSGERIVVHRASITAAERHLSEHGFVRIHRSTLVRRDRIARVRPQDVVLHDGTHLAIGKRFRSQLST